MPTQSPVPSDASQRPAPPSGPGAQAVTLAHPAPVVAALLRGLVPPEPPPVGRRRRVRWLCVALLLGAGAAALALDEALDFPRGAFGWLVPYSWLGVIAVFDALHPRPRARPPWLKGLGCMLVFFGAVLAVLGTFAYALFLQPLGGGSREGRSWGLWIAGSVMAIVVGLAFARLRHSGDASQSDAAARLRAAADVIEALCDDAVATKPVSGWVDVSGHAQPAKLVRSGTAASGVEVALYRDEWLRLRLALRDGNRLRLAAVDRVKVRAGRWKRGRGGKQKWKSGRSDWLSTVELQLVVNPAAYRVKDEPPAGAARATLKTGTGGAPTLTLVHSAHPATFEAAEMLRAVAGLYAQLERVQAAA